MAPHRQHAWRHGLVIGRRRLRTHRRPPDQEGQKKRKKVKSIYEYILQNDDLGLGQKLSKYLIKENIFEAKANIELDLIEALLSILI